MHNRTLLTSCSTLRPKSFSVRAWVRSLDGAQALGLESDVQGANHAPTPRKLSWKQLAAWLLCTVPAGAIAAGLFYVLLVARLSAVPHRYYAYRGSTVEQFVSGASKGGLRAVVTLPLTLVGLCLWDRLSRRLPFLESHRLVILVGTLALALPSTYIALLQLDVAVRRYEVELCVWLVIAASLWLPRAVVPALAPLGSRRAA